MEIEQLTEQHDRTTFDCGRPEITDWFVSHAWNQRSNVSSKVWVNPDRISGYFSLRNIVVKSEDFSKSISKSFDEGSGVSILLCKLGVHVDDQGNGSGKKLLLQSLNAALQAHTHSPVQLLSVDALDEPLAQFYEKFGFRRTTSRPLRLYMSMKLAKQISAP